MALGWLKHYIKHSFNSQLTPNGSRAMGCVSWECWWNYPHYNRTTLHPRQVYCICSPLRECEVWGVSFVSLQICPAFCIAIAVLFVNIDGRNLIQISHLTGMGSAVVQIRWSQDHLNNVISYSSEMVYLHWNAFCYTCILDGELDVAGILWTWVLSAHMQAYLMKNVWFIP